jgi:hypothetical protein
MEFFTIDRQYNKVEPIDRFLSAIWTERYKGDSAVELLVPANPRIIQILPVGTFLCEVNSDEPMIIETSEIEDNNLKVSGISLLAWMNNRFIRAAPPTDDELTQKTWTPSTNPVRPGWIIWNLLYNWCVNGPYLNGTINMGIPNPERLKIPITLDSYYSGDPKADFAIEYGPLYDAMKSVADEYDLGMRITVDLTAKILKFKNYKGIDRTGRQNVYSPIRFSSDSASLANVKELRSIQNYKTLVFSFPDGDPGGWTTVGGVAQSSNPGTGFNLRALQTYESSIDDPGSAAALVKILNRKAKAALQASKFIKSVDGEITPTLGFKYGTDFNMGDLIEMQGPSGIIAISRVTEYIRSQDASGEKAYPTVELVE